MRRYARRSPGRTSPGWRLGRGRGGCRGVTGVRLSAVPRWLAPCWTWVPAVASGCRGCPRVRHRRWPPRRGRRTYRWPRPGCARWGSRWSRMRARRTTSPRRKTAAAGCRSVMARSTWSPAGTRRSARLRSPGSWPAAARSSPSRLTFTPTTTCMRWRALMSRRSPRQLAPAGQAAGAGRGAGRPGSGPRGAVSRARRHRRGRVLPARRRLGHPGVQPGRLCSSPAGSARRGQDLARSRPAAVFPARGRQAIACRRPPPTSRTPTRRSARVLAVCQAETWAVRIRMFGVLSQASVTNQGRAQAMRARAAWPPDA